MELGRAGGTAGSGVGFGTKGGCGDISVTSCPGLSSAAAGTGRHRGALGEGGWEMGLALVGGQGAGSAALLRRAES